MAVLRAALFQLCFYLWGAGLVILFIPALLGPRQGSVLGMRIFGHGTAWLLKAIVGIRLEVRGRENLPKGGYIVAAKHQSAFDTLIYHPLLGDPRYGDPAANERARSTHGVHRTLLHGQRLTLPHPRDGSTVAVTAFAAPDLVRLFAAAAAAAGAD